MAERGGSLRRQVPARRRAEGYGRGVLRGRGSARRVTRYQVATPLLEREIGHSRVHVSPLLIDALLLVIAGWLLYWMATDDAFFISRLHVKGGGGLSEAELLSVSGLEGLHVFWVDTRAAERAIATLPGVQSVKMRCGLPANCEVTLVQERPLLVWRQGDAHVWVGAEGTVLPAREELPYAITIDARGSTTYIPGDHIDLELVDGVLELEQLQPEIQSYQYLEGLGLTFLSTYGWEVRLGDGQRVETKLQLMHAFADYFSRHGITPQYLDVRFPEAPVYGE